MNIISKERVLYDYYGEDHKIKLPEVAKSNKEIERHIVANYEREIAKAKVFEKTQKELFLKARWKLNEDLKRTLSSTKFEYKYKIKVLVGQIKHISKINNVSGLIAFELKKLTAQQKASAEYVKSAYKWIQKTDDTPDHKIESFEDIKAKEIQAEKKIITLMKILGTIDHLMASGFSLNSKGKIVDSDNSLVKEIDPLLFTGPLKSFVKSVKVSTIETIWSEFAANAKDLETTRIKIRKTLSKDISDIRAEARRVKRDIEIDFKSRILKAEYEYNEAYAKLKADALEKKRNALSDLKSKKQERLQKTNDVKQAIVNFTMTKKQSTSFVKLAAKSKSKSLILQYKYDFYSKLLSQAKVSIPKEIASNFEVSLKEFTLLSEKYVDEKIEYIKTKSKDSIVTSKSELSNASSKINGILKEVKSLIKNEKSSSKENRVNLSTHFGIYGEFEYIRLQKLKAKTEAKVEVSKSMREYTYNGDYLYKNSVHKINWINSWTSELDVLNSERREFSTSIKESKDKTVAYKESFAKNKKVILAEYVETVTRLKNDVKNNSITKKALSQKKMEARIFRREGINELKLSNPMKRAKGIVSSFKWRYLGKKKIWKKMYESKISEARKITPIEVRRGLRYKALILNLVAPGTAEVLLFKQYAKGIMMLAVTAFMWFFMYPFIMGWTSGKMGGLWGLSDMGASEHDWALGLTPDARYYLLGGVLSIILLIAMVVYFISSAISAYRIGLVMEHGARSVGWIQTKSWLGTKGFPWLIALPGWMLILIIVVTPIITSVLVSFTNMGFNHEPPGKTVDWVGLNQYGKWWLFKDAGMATSIGRVMQWTLIWTFTSAGLVIGLGTFVAVMVNQERIKFKKFWRLIYIIPWAIPAFVTIMFLKSAFQASGDSLINLMLLRMGIIDEAINWWTSIWTIRIILILLQGWLGHAYIFLLITGNMQSIPQDIYEAGSIDGAKGNQLFRHMTMPLLLRTIAPLLIAQFTFSFNNFTIISLFSGGGPQYLDPTPFLEGGTDILISWVYKLTTGVAQIDGNLGFSAAMSILASLMAISFASYGFAKSAAFRGS